MTRVVSAEGGEATAWAKCCRPKGIDLSLKPRMDHLS